MVNNEIYVSTDIETDGPIPGPHSMLSFASVAFDSYGNEIGRFSRNLETLHGAVGDPETMKWWETQQVAREHCRTNTVNPKQAMIDYVCWLKALPGKPVFVAYPAGFDWTFVYWYLIFFAKESPFGFQSLDVKSYAMAVLRLPFTKTSKKTMPSSWFPKDVLHTHIAIDDAKEQGIVFMRAMLENNSDYET